MTLEQGFSATTASIAQRAGVSEGTLFKRFATKEDLFVAAMGLSSYGDWRGVLLAQVGQGEVQKNLEQAALSVLRESDAWIRRMVVVFSRGVDPSHNPVLARLEDYSQADIAALVGYLRAETELGRVRPHDVDVTALAIMGALGGYMHRCAVGPPGQDISQMLDTGRYVRGVMDVLWPGLKP